MYLGSHLSIERMRTLVQEEVFSIIDLFFAQTLLKNASTEVQEESLFLFAYVFSIARQGHFCLEILSDEKINPSPAWMTGDEEIVQEIEQRVWHV
jgi:hypothetical protein